MDRPYLSIENGVKGNKRNEIGKIISYPVSDHHFL